MILALGAIIGAALAWLFIAAYRAPVIEDAPWDDITFGADPLDDLGARRANPGGSAPAVSFHGAEV